MGPEHQNNDGGKTKSAGQRTDAFHLATAPTQEAAFQAIRSLQDLSPADVLALQRTVGNAAVNRLLQGMHTMQQTAGPVMGTPQPSGVSISDPSDRFEQAGESSAANVLSAAPLPVQRHADSNPQPHASPASAGGAGGATRRDELPPTLSSSGPPAAVLPGCPSVVQRDKTGQYQELHQQIVAEQGQADGGTRKYFILSLAVTAQAQVRSRGGITESGHGWVEVEMIRPWEQEPVSPGLARIQPHMTETTQGNLKRIGQTSFGFYPAPTEEETSTLLKAVRQAKFMVHTKGNVIEPEQPQMLANTAAKKDYRIDEEQAIDFFRFVTAKVSSPPAYSFARYNCTSFALDAIRAAGISVSSSLGPTSTKTTVAPNKVFKRIYERAAMGDASAHVKTELGVRKVGVNGAADTMEDALIEKGDQAALDQAAAKERVDITANLAAQTLNASPAFKVVWAEAKRLYKVGQELTVDNIVAGGNASAVLQAYALCTPDEQRRLHAMYGITDDGMRAALWGVISQHGLDVQGVLTNVGTAALIKLLLNDKLDPLAALTLEHLHQLKSDPDFTKATIAPLLAWLLNLPRNAIRAGIARAVGGAVLSNGVTLTLEALVELRGSGDLATYFTAAQLNALSFNDQMLLANLISGGDGGHLNKLILEAKVNIKVKILEAKVKTSLAEGLRLGGVTITAATLARLRNNPNSDWAALLTLAEARAAMAAIVDADMIALLSKIMNNYLPAAIPTKLTDAVIRLERQEEG